MPDTTLQRIDQHRGVINSTKGGWKIGKGVTNHGFSQLDDLVGQTSFLQVVVLNVTGKLPDVRFAQWLEATFICCSWPDPRIWCNQIGALGGDARISTLAAVFAGTLASDSTTYGPGTVPATSDLLLAGKRALSDGWSIADFVELKGRRKGRLLMSGFARPIAHGDDRVDALHRLAGSLGFECGPTQELAFAIHDYLLAEYKEAINMGGYVVAFMLDQGYTSTEIERILTLLVSGGVHACYTEYRDLPVETFLPLRCEDLEYTGVSERPLPNDQ